MRCAVHAHQQDTHGLMSEEVKEGRIKSRQKSSCFFMFRHRSVCLYPRGVWHGGDGALVNCCACVRCSRQPLLRTILAPGEKCLVLRRGAFSGEYHALGEDRPRLIPPTGHFFFFFTFFLSFFYLATHPLSCCLFFHDIFRAA